jgi:hypothetical protein
MTKAEEGPGCNLNPFAATLWPTVGAKCRGILEKIAMQGG